eukprot:114951_1
MSYQIIQPVNQVRLTNVAVVRLNRHGKRFEVACYRNKILNYRQGIETDLSEVLQTDRVFTNVSKGQFAPSKDLVLAFDTSDQEQCCRFILDKGQIQVSDMERSATLENTAREVANMVATKCGHPISNRPYTTSQIRDAMKKSDFSVQPVSARSVKQQFLDCVKAIQVKGVLEIQRAKMELGLVLSDGSHWEYVYEDLIGEAQALVHNDNDNDNGNDNTNKKSGDDSDSDSGDKQRIEFFIDPSKFRAVDAIAKKYGAALEIMRQIVTQEGDVEVSVELERNTNAAAARQQEIQNMQSTTNAATAKGTATATGQSSYMDDLDEISNKMGTMQMGNASRPYLDDSDDDNGNGNSNGAGNGNGNGNNDDDFHQPQMSTRKKNKRAAKKSKKAKRREKEESAARQDRKEAEQSRRDQRELRLGQQAEAEAEKQGGQTETDICKKAGTTGAAGTILKTDSLRKSCNTCGGDFTPSEYRAHFRSDWHRYNMKLKLKGMAAIDEKEFEMFAEDFF